MLRQLTITLVCLILMAVIATAKIPCIDTTCKTCNNSSDICDQCKVSYYLFNNSCIPCATEVANCSECTYNNDTSITCSNCVSSYVFNPADGKCLSCTTADPKCTSCSIDATSTVVCTACKEGTILNDTSCIACPAALDNCNVCNDTFFPVSCVNCQSPYYASQDSSLCDLCQNLIPDCSACAFQAPYERLQCQTCGQGKELSDDKYSCNDPSHLILILGIVIGALIVIGAVGFGVYCYKKKRAERTSFHDQEDSYEKV